MTYMTAQTQQQIKDFLLYPDQTIRICSKEARELLLHNEKIIIGGNIRYFQMIPVGIEIYAVRLLPLGWDESFGTVCLDRKTPWITTEKTMTLRYNEKVCSK
jgi:hypothetical protein